MKTHWLNRTLFEFPYCYRLCITEKDFHAELKRLGLSKEHWPAFLKTTHANATTNFFQSKDGEFSPSPELEAYAVQRLAQNLIWSWRKQVKK